MKAFLITCIIACLLVAIVAGWLFFQSPDFTMGASGISALLTAIGLRRNLRAETELDTL